MHIKHNNNILQHDEKIKQLRPHPSLLGWRLDENRQAKEIIGNKSDSIIQDNETVFLGEGSTVFYILQNIIHKKNLTVVTNSLYIINILFQHPEINLITIGGRWKSRTLSFEGVPSDYWNSIALDRSFIGALAIDTKKGTTQRDQHDNIDELYFFQKAKHQYVVADSSKFNITYQHTVLDTNHISNIITDTMPENIKEWQEKNITII